MISSPDRKTTALLIDEAMAAGVRRTKACAALQISERTLRRWRQGMPAGEATQTDGRVRYVPRLRTNSAMRNARTSCPFVILRNSPACHRCLSKKLSGLLLSGVSNSCR